MTEQVQPQQQAAPSATATGGDTRGRVEKLLPDILGLMGYPARLEFRDASDGSLAVALHFEAGSASRGGERQAQPGAGLAPVPPQQDAPPPGRRAALGAAGRGRLPRAPASQGGPGPRACSRAGCRRGASSGGSPEGSGPRSPARCRHLRGPLRPAPPPAAPPPAKRGEADERTVEVAEDAVLKEAARQLAGKSGSLGRFYAIAAMKLEDRSRVMKAVEGVAGVTVTAEGEGRCRRVVFTPEKPAPLPRKLLLPDDDEDDFEG